MTVQSENERNKALVHEYFKAGVHECRPFVAWSSASLRVPLSMFQPQRALNGHREAGSVGAARNDRRAG
jgi:hypothetical protein